MKNVFRRKKELDVKDFTQRWQALQKHCVTRKTWPQAIIEADNLLCDALKKSRYKGKSTGERLVAAQRMLSDNEGVWFGHKFCKQIGDQDVRKIKKQDVMDALTGFRQALRDLGALEK
ncbi:MAG: hypothetical protein JWO35_299 [Candidatus Saccharibacteria bacterium]|nr:hypothetical protein [Candidatus Saccharibacteria bacterium]